MPPIATLTTKVAEILERLSAVLAAGFIILKTAATVFI
jgi:hypothetical protein